MPSKMGIDFTRKRDGHPPGTTSNCSRLVHDDHFLYDDLFMRCGGLPAAQEATQDEPTGDRTVNRSKLRRFWITTSHRRLESWRELGDALRREWRILTRRREITPKMVLAAIAAAGVGWGIAYLVDSLPS
jgi:hypothetical protein